MSSNTSKSIVVYADDDLDDLELVQEAFEHYSRNVEVVTFTDGSRALSYLKSLNDNSITPCLIILDINMPIINGKDVLIKLREIEELQSVPVVLFTTSSLPSDRAFAHKHNAGFITKPIDVTQMELIADEFISHCADEVRDKIRKKTS